MCHSSALLLDSCWCFITSIPSRKSSSYWSLGTHWCTSLHIVILCHLAIILYQEQNRINIRLGRSSRSTMASISFMKTIQDIPATKWASALACVPLLLWSQDCLFSLYRVRGSSMEPSLKNGDIVVVRKSDGFWQRQTRKDQDPMLTFQRDHQRELERRHCNSNGVGAFLHRPPMPVVDDIVVYQDPKEYLPQYSIKRVIGLGQQIIMMPSNRYRPNSEHQIDGGRRYADSSSMRLVSPHVPSYSLWVEGDNTANSSDSRTDHGPISKKLLVGIAEYRVWPPTRIEKLGPSTDLRGDSKPYSYWPNV